MSIQETKEALAAAISAVAGIKGSAKRPRALRQGDAFVRWRSWSREDGPGGAAFVAIYSVIVVLPGDEEAADAYIYDRADAIEQALQPVMWIDSFEPTMMPTEAGEMFTLTITGRVE